MASPSLPPGSPSGHSPVPGCRCPACTSGPGGGWSAPRSATSSSAPHMSGFDGHGSRDFDFAVGYVRGYRWWKINAPDLSRSWDEWRLGQLTGVQNGAWGPGVNKAKCNYVPGHQPPVEYDSETKNGCGCGYWGYWELQQHNVGSVMPVAGVIEGSGRTLVGERGFRSELARIVALYMPWDLTPAPGWSAWAPDNRALLPGPANVHGASLTEGGVRTFNAITGRDDLTRYGGGAAGGGYRVQGDALGGGGAEPEPQPMSSQEEEKVATQYGLAWMAVIQDRLQQLYPEAEIFATRKAMLAKYPPVGSPGPEENR